MKQPHLVVLVSMIFMLAGCTSISVRSLQTQQRITEVYIKENPRVEVEDFVDVLIEGFARNGISAKVAPNNADLTDKYVVSYVAYRKWDLKAYLSQATIRIELNGQRIGYAEYKHSGGFGLNKWASTKEKLDPVIDKLLEGNVDAEPETKNPFLRVTKVSVSDGLKAPLRML